MGTQDVQETIQSRQGAALSTDGKECDESGSVNDLLSQAQQVLSGTSVQLRTLVALGAAELDLAVAASTRALVTAVMLAAALLHAITFGIVGMLMLFIGPSTTVTLAVLICSVCSALLAIALYLLLHSLLEKMQFRNLRKALARGKSENTG